MAEVGVFGEDDDPGGFGGPKDFFVLGIAQVQVAQGHGLHVGKGPRQPRGDERRDVRVNPEGHAARRG